MIGVICLNPALDITYHVPAVDWTGVNRPSSVRARPGGKGLNVARTLRSLGAEVLVMGLAGGITGAGVDAALRELGVPADFVPVGGETRRTVTIVDGRGGEAASFNEPGPVTGAAEFGELCARYDEALAGCAAVVLSGSLPPGLPADSYATLIEMAAAAGVPAVLDTHGEALLRGAAACPAIVKPNLAELEALTGRPLCTARGADRQAVAAAAGQLRATGAQAVVASLGAAGLLATTQDGSWHAFPPAAVTGNATGAGDAVAAGLAHGLVLGRPWDERLRHAVALGTACAAAPAAGEFSPADYASILGRVTVCRDGDR
ncbi:MAG: 1-phosphofructokinase family hexose kinase [Streptosporangiaceae bacterium]|nr:1-phosphofructokinase family hexose kinase [Streptosporangiaceae bacterium]MBV9858303.1 1-phosphofructokinase family hexose kinase [Streptosporangiaceae bacterium]